MAEHPSKALQESLLTLLAVDDTHGKIVAALVDPALFDPIYRDVASTILNFRAKFGKAPGPGHLDDIFDSVLESPNDAKAEPVKFILRSILEQRSYINGPYVLSKVENFLRHQRLKKAVLDAAAKYSQGGENVADDVEGILLSAVKSAPSQFSPGTRFSDINRVLGYLNPDDSDTLELGIPAIDKRGLGPTVKELLLFIAPRKRGKSHFCVHCGCRAILPQNRWPTLHISLEMSEKRVALRYLQNLFSIAKTSGSYQQSVFTIDEFSRLTNLAIETRTPMRTLSDDNIRAFLRDNLRSWGTRFGNLLVIKEFPTKQLTTKRLISYIDWLGNAEGFYPKQLIIDYPTLMAFDVRDYRHGLGTTVEEIRGICVERGMAGVAPAQGNRQSETSETTRGDQVAEDISLVATADTVITDSQTRAERALKLARLNVDQVRNAEANLEVLITQNYGEGQFVLQSAYMNSDVYWPVVNAREGGPETSEAAAD